MRLFLDITASSDRRETVFGLFVGAEEILFPLRSEVEFAVLTMLESMRGSRKDFCKYCRS